MAAYVVLIAREYPDNRSDVMRPYIEQVEATMARYGGGYRTFLSHRVEVVEGDWGPHRGVVVVGFPTFAQARAWYDSPEYAPLKALRLRHMRFDTILLDGLEDEDIAARTRVAAAEALRRWGAAPTTPEGAPDNGAGGD